MLVSIAWDTWTYVRVLLKYLKGGDYEGSTPFAAYGDDAMRMGVHVYSLALALKLWDEPHYRKSSYAADVRDNFRNVAIPGTGIPLSVLASNKFVTKAFLVFVYPVVCFVAAIGHVRRNGNVTVAAAYREQLLAPRDWFSLWRINSRLAAWHSLVTRSPTATDPTDGWHEYAMENKWAFLEKGFKLGVPVSPVLSSPSKLCIKHKNEEGGMGIYFYDNALNGGDWIIQEVMENSDVVASLLPKNAPLSTFRVMTASNMYRLQKDKTDDVFALSCVFRAGRAGAKTDHSSILFDVDVKTGTIGRGTTNAQWYQLGKTVGVPWGPPPEIFNHPDTNKRVTGATIPDFHKSVLDVAIQAHKILLPRVPLAGWDVVLSKDHGSCLLEVNLSCNFFKGSFDEPKYFDFIHKFFLFCQHHHHQLQDSKLA